MDDPPSNQPEERTALPNSSAANGAAIRRRHPGAGTWLSGGLAALLALYLVHPWFLTLPILYAARKGRVSQEAVYLWDQRLCGPVYWMAARCRPYEIFLQHSSKVDPTGLRAWWLYDYGP